MTSMKLYNKLNINWSLWMGLSIPLIIYNWTHLRDVKGWMVSDWGYLSDFLHRTGYTVTHDIWDYFAETFFWDAVPALIVGFILHYLIMLFWQAWRIKKAKQSIENTSIL